MRALTRLFVVCAAALVVSADQATFSTNEAHMQPVLLTPELKKLVQEVVNNETIPGLSLAVVHSGGSADFATWGHKTEDGDEMTSDVSLDTRTGHAPRLTHGNMDASTDYIRHGLLLQSVFSQFFGDPHGRLRARPQ